MDYILLHNRARLVKKYRQNKHLWPDGIDTAGDRWYGDGGGWPDEKVELMSSVRWLEERLAENDGKGRRRVFSTLKGEAVTPVTAVTPVAVTASAADIQRQKTRERVARLRARRLLKAAEGKG